MQATRDLYDEEGFLKTGDVVEQHDHETFIWLDRVKNIIKLAQVLPPSCCQPCNSPSAQILSFLTSGEHQTQRVALSTSLLSRTWCKHCSADVATANTETFCCVCVLYCEFSWIEVGLD